MKKRKKVALFELLNSKKGWMYSVRPGQQGLVNEQTISAIVSALFNKIEVEIDTYEDGSISVYAGGGRFLPDLILEPDKEEE